MWSRKRTKLLWPGLRDVFLWSYFKRKDISLKLFLYASLNRYKLLSQHIDFCRELTLDMKPPSLLLFRLSTRSLFHTRPKVSFLSESPWNHGAWQADGWGIDVCMRFQSCHLEKENRLWNRKGESERWGMGFKTRLKWFFTEVNSFECDITDLFDNNGLKVI